MKLVTFFICTVFLSGCVSLSKINSEITDVDSRNLKVKKLDLFVASDFGEYCFSDEQKNFIARALEKYGKSDSVSVKLYESMDGNKYLTALYIGASVGTLTIIPLFYTRIYYVEIKDLNSKSEEIYTAQFEDRNLVSIFALPFAFSNSPRQVRRANLENAIYRAFSKPPENRQSIQVNAEMGSECSEKKITPMTW